MKLALVFAALCLSSSLTGQVPTEAQPDAVPRLEGLNTAQQKAVADYIQQHEIPTGEYRVLASRKGIGVRSSDAVRALFPGYRVVTVTWIYQADAEASHRYSIPGPIRHSLLLDENGSDCLSQRIANEAEFAGLLRLHKIKVADEASARQARLAFGDIYEIRLNGDDQRFGAEWRLGYSEHPFRAISSYEEIREASYYRLLVDESGLVVGGSFVTDILERRPLKQTSSQ